MQKYIVSSKTTDAETVILLMMVRFTFDNRTGTVDLFGEGKTYHLVGEGHL